MIAARGHVNGDDCFLAWTAPFTKDCWGFAIHRDLIRPDGARETGYLRNRVGFEDEPATPHGHRPSTEWPFQRYTWTDHDVAEGDTVTYTIASVLHHTRQGLTVDKTDQATVGPLTITGAASPVRAYFNRGVLLSQFIAKRLGPEFTRKDITKLTAQLAEHDDELRVFLTGQLGGRLIQLLDDTKAQRWHLYAALYELTDPELIDRLAALGRRAHVVLANGSEKKNGSDGNEAAAAMLTAANVELHRRMLWSEGLGHNKFVVFAPAANQPRMVWTGSNNWATTALCTQLNNAVLADDPELANIYLQQWKRLRDDRRVGRRGQPMHFGPELLAANDKPKTGGGRKNRWTVWFTRTTDGQDLNAATDLINDADQAILFLMFEPGSTGLLQVVQARLSPAAATYNPDLYVHGVVNTLKPAATGETVSVDLVGRGTRRHTDLRVVQPEGVRGGLAGWAAEVTRADFLRTRGGVVGYAINHSKTIILDPFTRPVVITGSHNFSQSASVKNDENLLIVKGNPALAERYAVNIMGAYQHYRWRAYLAQRTAERRSPWSGLVKDETWQDKQAPHDHELAFWVHHTTNP